MKKRGQPGKLVLSFMVHRVTHDVPRERAAREIGVSLATVYRWEKGVSVPTGLCRTALQDYLRKNGAG